MNYFKRLSVRNSTRTGIPLTVLGLGGGGGSRIGEAKGTAEDVLSVAAEFGVGYIDTAEDYGTEEIIGRCLGFWTKTPVLSSKLSYKLPNGRFKSISEIEQSFYTTLKLLRVPKLSIYYIHGVLPEDYSEVCRSILPILCDLKNKGMIGAIGVTESFNKDAEHKMLLKAVNNNYWDFIMTGINLLNRSALSEVIPQALAKGIGIVAMFAVRNALSSWEALEAYLDSLNWFDATRALQYTNLRRESQCDLPSLAYRYVRDLPGIESVLTGTSNPDHLRKNIHAMCSESLSQDQRQGIDDLFSTLPVCTGQ